jgi:hypothetical protein
MRKTPIIGMFRCFPVRVVNPLRLVSFGLACFLAGQFGSVWFGLVRGGRFGLLFGRPVWFAPISRRPTDDDPGMGFRSPAPRRAGGGALGGGLLCAAFGHP